MTLVPKIVAPVVAPVAAPAEAVADHVEAVVSDVTEHAEAAIAEAEERAEIAEEVRDAVIESAARDVLHDRIEKLETENEEWRRLADHANNQQTQMAQEMASMREEMATLKLSIQAASPELATVEVVTEAEPEATPDQGQPIDPILSVNEGVPQEIRRKLRRFL